LIGVFLSVRAEKNEIDTLSVGINQVVNDGLALFSLSGPDCEPLTKLCAVFLGLFLVGDGLFALGGGALCRRKQDEGNNE